MIEELATVLGVKKGFLVAGGFGAVVSLAFIQGPLWYRMVLFMGGLFSSVYVTPIINAWIGLSADSYGMAFVVGLFSMSLSARIIQAVQQADFQAINEGLRSWLGR